MGFKLGFFWSVPVVWGSPPPPLTLMEEYSSNPEERDEDREVL